MFCYSGEVKVLMEHEKHVAQFPKIFADAARTDQTSATLPPTNYFSDIFKSVRY